MYVCMSKRECVDERECGECGNEGQRRVEGGLYYYYSTEVSRGVVALCMCVCACVCELHHASACDSRGVTEGVRGGGGRVKSKQMNWETRAQCTHKFGVHCANKFRVHTC